MHAAKVSGTRDDILQVPKLRSHRLKFLGHIIPQGFEVFSVGHGTGHTECASGLARPPGYDLLDERTVAKEELLDRRVARRTAGLLADQVVLRDRKDQGIRVLDAVGRIACGVGNSVKIR